MLHGSHIAVAWDGGQRATRAMAGAMPILASAAQVTVLAYAEHVSDELDAAPVSALRIYLDRHGIDTRMHTLPTELDIGEAIINGASKIGADMIVAGCYGHARVRELLTGGVTRTLMQRAKVALFTSN